MKTEDKLICDYMHEFTNKHWDKIDKEKCSLTDTKNKFLINITNDLYEAMWMLDEVCVWGMDKRYLKDLYVEISDDYNFRVLKINDKYIKVEYKWQNGKFTLSFCEPKFKQVIYFD